MTRKFLTILMLSAAFPFAVAAQTDNAQSPSTPMTPGATDSQTGTGAADTTNRVQTPAPGAADQSASASSETFVTIPETGAWRVSDLEGKSVYDPNGESIGEINDVLVSQDGSVNAVIIGVGGFLGIGEKDVAVNIAALQLKPGMTQEQADAATGGTGAAVSGETTGSTTPNATTATPPAQGGADNTVTGTGMPEADNDQMAANDNRNVEIGEDGLPDRIVLNVSRAELENAPAFQGIGGDANDGAATTTP
ncbi:PRC-barrel domain-containing protein [Pseudomonas sp. R2.Fl]|nr:PRC-barrel domain-containing protein [Pseudomonas sp. R2.Fl]